MIKVVLLGANGLLGEALQKARPEGVILVCATKEVLDICNPWALDNAFSKFAPDVVINCAAYTKVDAAEEEPGATTSWQVNAMGARHVARACKEVNARLIHLSTDYVFGGRGGDVVFFERDPPEPLNVYGWTKLAGERFVQQECRGALVVRTSGLFGGERDFVSAILRQLRADDSAPIRVVNDQTLSPTSAADLAGRLLELAADSGAHHGILHVTNSGRCSWYEFAREIVKLEGGDVERVVPISTAELGRPARRPAVSVLRTNHVGQPLRSWQEALLDMSVRRDVLVAG